ncbi:MAG: TssQ family T6SS-associated lipoprotein [Aquabacterium sp.]
MTYHHTLPAWASMSAAVALVLGLSACSHLSKKDAPAASDAAASAPAAPASSPAVADVPVGKTPSVADAALADGLKSYQAGQYRQAESQLKTALQAGLKLPADVANADKHLAFIYCMTKRDTLCATSFKAAKAADPGFALSKTEAGHPMWAKTYKKAMGLK